MTESKNIYFCFSLGGLAHVRVPSIFTAVDFRTRRVYGLDKGSHLLVDCRNVSRDVCTGDARMLDVLARAATQAGATVVSQVRYRFGAGSPPGFTAFVLLDESHCSAHTYADLGLVALDIFTCGTTEPGAVLDNIRLYLDLGDVTVREVPRFLSSPAQTPPHKIESPPVSIFDPP